MSGSVKLQTKTFGELYNEFSAYSFEQKYEERSRLIDSRWVGVDELKQCVLAEKKKWQKINSRFLPPNQDAFNAGYIQAIDWLLVLLDGDKK